MAQVKASLPRGMRDYAPDIMQKRKFIFNTIQSAFEKFGFQPLETPALENLNVLTGKYGEEGDQLLFKVLQSGNFLDKTTEDDYQQGAKQMLPKIADKGLRYDLTVPFARYVVMNRHNITFPFKRYQMQPVWRADRPQKGRYREFYQCDADVIGTNSLLCEAELLSMAMEVFHNLGITNYSIKVNTRKLLNGLAEKVGHPDKVTGLCTAIDKLDKIGEEKVKEELVERGFSQSGAESILAFISITGSSKEKMDHLQETFRENKTGKAALSDLQTLFQRIESLNAENPDASQKIELDVSLARGLAYYTGMIFEIKVHDTGIGSVGGGGRYDDLTSVFGVNDVSGVGISFGVDRIFDVMEALNLFEEKHITGTKVLVSNFNEETLADSLKIVSTLRKNEIPAEIYTEPAKLKKQFQYAEKKNIPFLLMAGENEIQNEQYGLKNLSTGDQETLALQEIIDKLKRS